MAEVVEEIWERVPFYHTLMATGAYLWVGRNAVEFVVLEGGWAVLFVRAGH
jgi:hypothetical protein